MHWIFFTINIFILVAPWELSSFFLPDKTQTWKTSRDGCSSLKSWSRTALGELPSHHSPAEMSAFSVQPRILLYVNIAWGSSQPHSAHSLEDQAIGNYQHCSFLSKHFSWRAASQAPPMLECSTRTIYIVTIDRFPLFCGQPWPRSWWWRAPVMR